MNTVARIYLDHNATTPLREEVSEGMMPYFTEFYGNSASRHSAGQDAWVAVERAREQVAQLVGASADEVIFTSGASESNFMALTGRFEELLLQRRRPETVRIAVSAIEHPCVKNCALKLARRGAQVEVVPAAPDGRVDLSFFDDDPAWDIVSVMAVNHETGAIQPLSEISERLDAGRTFFHTDAAQWAGRMPGSLRDWGTAGVSLSAHKMYGPKGIGALILKKGERLTPLMPGSQEGGYRAGTVNVPGVVGFGLAAEWMRREMYVESRRLADLRERFWSLLQQRGLKVRRTIFPEHALANTLHVCFPGIRGERVVDALDRRGICCSAGPACASGASEASPVLLAMGYDDNRAWEGVRFSLGRTTTGDDLERTVQVLSESLPAQAQHVA